MSYAIAVVIALAGAAIPLGWLTPLGSIAAALVGSLTAYAGGWQWLSPMVWFVLSANILGKLCGAQAAKRTAAQVFANGLAPSLAAAAHCLGLLGGAGAFLASVCCAASDTWATEIGSRFGSDHFHLVRRSRAAPGPSGVVSLIGFVGGVLGAATTASVGLLMSLSTTQCIAAGLIGFAGCIFDSLLGDTLQSEGQRTGPLTNDTTNLVSTLAAGVAGYFLAN